MLKEEFSMKKVFSMTRDEQKKLFSNIMDWVEGKNTEDELPTKDEIYFMLEKQKIYFFAFMDEGEKERYVHAAVKYIKEFNTFVYQMTEVMSHIYKFVSSDLQSLIFDAYYEVYERLLETNRGITTVSIFVKNTHQAYNEEQEEKSQKVLAYLKKISVGALKDTYEYIYENYDRKFVPTPEAKVLLLIPEFQTATSFVQPPLCMMNVYSLLRKDGIKVDIMDNRVFGYSFEQVRDLVQQYEFIAFTSTPLDQVQTYFLDYRHTLFCNMVNYLKSNLANVKKIIVCGSHGTVRPDIILNTINPDILIKGEYDFQLADLLNTLIKNESIEDFPNIIEKIDGKCYEHRIDESKMHPEEWVDSMIDYSIVPVPDYYGYQFVNNTHLKKRNWSIMQTTRGCPYNCIFCFNFYTKKVRYKNIENVIKEMKQLQERNVLEIFFIDQTFTVDKEYTKKLCSRIVEEGINIKWTCETRIDLIDEPTLALMKQAGCYAIWFGIESFDEEVLNINKKGYTSTDFDETIDLLRKYDMDYRAFIMIGMKGETKESLKKTVDTIVKSRIKLSKTIVQCQERFGTQMYDDIPEEQKMQLNRFELLGLRKGRLSDKIDQEDINNAVKRLMELANKND